MTQAAVNKFQWQDRPLDASQIATVSGRLLQWAENNGYPFARVWLETVRPVDTAGIYGSFMLDRGPLQLLDSIAIESDVRISRNYLLRYLDLKQGEPYNEKKLMAISNRLREISFLQEAQPWSVSFNISDTRLNIHLKEKKANQLNGIVGLLPNSVETGKFLLTVDALFAFRNILARGESIDVSYQNLQYKSPRFKADIVYPYILNTPLGVDVHFDLFKKDTTFRRTTFQGGLRYQLSSADYIRVFYQHQSNRLITVDTSFIRASKRLPEDIDVSANGGGVEAGINRTDYRISPRKGFEARLTTSVLVRQIRKSDAVTAMTDVAGFDFNALYDTLVNRQNQYFISGQLRYYLPLSRKLIFRSGYDGGWVSGGNLFRNELYQIGGFRLLRGFDEQSIFSNQYHVISLELRVLLGQNSYFYLFSDNGYVQSNFSVFRKDDIYNGFGIGTTLETKSGLFSISYALGRNSVNPIQFRQSKIHFGYVAFF
jgi:outer membrane protein assembly factor BamA